MIQRKTIILTIALLAICMALAAVGIYGERLNGSATQDSQAAAPGASPVSADSAAHRYGQNAEGNEPDWCSEHRTPESQCTACNPDLVAGFKTRGDWCSEHGLPE